MAANAKELKIRCVQLSPVIGESEQNIQRLEVELRLAAADAIDLLVLPELATCGYSLTPAEARDSSQRSDDPLFTRWLGLLGDHTTAVFGFSEDGGDVLYNSAVLLTSGSDPVFYRKLHLWDTEKTVFQSGSAAPPVVRTPIGNIGVIICYDLEFPELPRSLALRGADLIAVPTNWPLLPRPEHEHPPEVVQAMAAARASGVVIACCDRSGIERGTEWTEGTTVIGADGWPVGEWADGQQWNATVQMDPERRRISTRNHLLEDRRPEQYGRVAEPLG